MFFLSPLESRTLESDGMDTKIKWNEIKSVDYFAMMWAILEEKWIRIWPKLQSWGLLQSLGSKYTLFLQNIKWNLFSMKSVSSFCVIRVLCYICWQGCSYGGRRRAAPPSTHIWSPPLKDNFSDTAHHSQYVIMCIYHILWLIL